MFAESWQTPCPDSLIFIILLLSTALDHRYICLGVHSHNKLQVSQVLQVLREDLKDMTSTSSVNSTYMEMQTKKKTTVSLPPDVQEGTSSRFEGIWTHNWAGIGIFVKLSSKF